MDLRTFLAHMAERVKKNPKLLDHEMKLQQYDPVEQSDHGTVSLSSVEVKSKLYKGDQSIIVLG